MTFRDYLNGTEAFRQGYDDAAAGFDDPTGYVAWARDAMDTERAAAAIRDYENGVAAGTADETYVCRLCGRDATYVDEHGVATCDECNARYDD